MSGDLVLRVQTKLGRSVVRGLAPNSSLWNLQKLVEEKTSIRPDSQKILYGYPPREIPSYDPTITLQTLHLKSGETIIVDETATPRLRTVASATDSVSTLQPPPAMDDLALLPEATAEQNTHKPSEGVAEILPSSADSASQTSGSQAAQATLSSAGGTGPGYRGGSQALGKLARKVVPADNSCLFRSIGVLLGDGGDNPGLLRQLAAGIILSDPQTYSTAMLDKTNQQYVDWLLREKSWGGAIELAVFSEHYKTELDVVDVQTQRIDRFGEGKGYGQRALLIYDGIHYDPLVLERGAGSTPQKIFPVNEETVLFQAQEMAKEAYKARQFTNVHQFALRCLVCGQGLVGQEDAVCHATATGHTNFGETEHK